MSKRFDLQGRSVLISGPARGIGAEAARRLNARGARLGLVGLEPERLRALAEELGGDTLVVEADVTDRDGMRDAVAEVRDHFGGIDVVVANAGVAPPTEPMLTVDPDAFERVLEINLYGVWRTVQPALPSIVERRGHVLVIASIYAFFNGVVAAPYAASKAAVEQLGRALRVELAPHGATAGVAYFGFVDTDLVRDAFAHEAVDDLRRALPGFITEPIDVTRVGTAIVDGIERRRSRVTAPSWVRVALPLRGPLAALDRLLSIDPRIAKAVRRAEQASAHRAGGRRPQDTACREPSTPETRREAQTFRTLG